MNLSSLISTTVKIGGSNRMRYLLFIFTTLITFAGCVTTQQQVEKEIEQCIIVTSEDHFDSDEKINASNLALSFEDLLLDKYLLVDRSPKAYQDLFDLMNKEMIDSTELERFMRDSYNQNLNLLYSPTLYAAEYSCVADAKEKFPEVFEASESLQGLFESSDAFRQTKNLESLVNSITNSIPEAEFQKKTVYRLPVIIAMYGIMEQVYSRYRNPDKEE